jgi:hypothetical protein
LGRRRPPRRRPPPEKRGSPKGQKAAKGGKAKASPKKEAKASKKAKHTHAKKASTSRAGSKGAKVLELIGRPKGATIAEIVKATDWQKHSIRNFLSTAAKKHGLKIESTKTEAGDRVYQVKKQGCQADCRHLRRVVAFLFLARGT